MPSDIKFELQQNHKKIDIVYLRLSVNHDFHLKCTTGTVTLCRLSIIVQRKIQSPSP